MSISEYKQEAREALDVLYDIADEIESALSESDDYWTWATFFKDKQKELMPVKDKGQEAVQRLQESVEGIRSEVGDQQFTEIFDEIDERKNKVSDVVNSIRDFASIQAAVTQGEKLAGLLEELLQRFRETSEAVEKLLDAMEE